MVGTLIKEDVEKNGAMTAKSECLDNAFTFFIGKISQKGAQLPINLNLAQDIIIKQLQFHRKLVNQTFDYGELCTKKVAAKGLEKPQELYKNLIQENEADLLCLIK